MIVVDTNVIHYCWVRGENTKIAQAVRQQDPEWHVPILWRSELRNVLTAYLRRGMLTREQIVGILSAADQALAEREHIILDALVLDVVASSTLTAYDAEFVALATALSVPLVTADKGVLKAFPERALTMAAFLSAQR
ncbi:MAG TPA: type II toxin-antitoxin system VapC family toxin [Casimicrobiaceae bacterium]|nr:type II toxin-antitoxin system VapC family toxin [Casimicrobiaceae bacterium]